MSRLIAPIALILVLGGGVIGYFSTFIVHQTEQAIVLQFGAAQRVVTEPGLYLKWPFFQNVVTLSKRLLSLDSSTAERDVPTVDQKRVLVDAFARWKIVDPLKFYQTQGTVAQARDQLDALVKASVRDIVAQHPLIVPEAGSEVATRPALLSERRAEIMRRMKDDVNLKVAAIGIEVVDVRLRRVDLPTENSQAVFLRMEAERQSQAARFRADGDRDALARRAMADTRVAEIRASAQREAEQTRGTGDAGRACVYADAYGRDPDFFSFYRSLRAYEASLQGANTTIVLSPDSEFFRYFGELRSPSTATSPSGTKPPAEALVPRGAAADDPCKLYFPPDIPVE